MQKKILFSILFMIVTCSSFAQVTTKSNATLFEADNAKFQYIGRIDFSNQKLPRFWAAGVYIKAKFSGPTCEIILNDQELWGKSHNYLEIAVDDKLPYRIQTTEKVNTINVEDLSDETHTITICKNTEANIGYLEFVGLRCKKLLKLPAKPKRKIEFIGNSITCGTGSDLSVVPCGKGQWHDQHNAYLSYGPTTARALNAQWHLTSVSGIGLTHSCCDLKITMPQVFDKISQRDDTIHWDVKSYQPDAVTICLGQNDGIQDSVTFCTAYINFIKQLRTAYPAAHLVTITSPMADATLVKVMKNYLTGIVDFANASGDKNVSKFFFSRSFNSGCDGHPDLKEHQLISNELTAYLKTTLNW